METQNISLIEYFNDHYYKVVEDDNVFFIPSVTTKLGIIDKPQLNRWRGDIGNREADLRMYEAANRGKRIHWAYETFLKGGVVIYDPWQKPTHSESDIEKLRVMFGQVAILRTQDEMIDVWKLQRQYELLGKPKILAVEQMVYDTIGMDAGTIDNILEIKEGEYPVSGVKPLVLEEGIYINDLKTGKYVDDRVWLQLAPYGFMYERMTGKRIAGALVSHTGATIRGGIQGLKTMFRSRKQLLGDDYDDYRFASQLWLREHRDDKPQEFQFPSLITLNLKEPKP